MRSVDELKKLFEAGTGQSWNNDEGGRWLMKNFPNLDIYYKEYHLLASAYVSLSLKANFIAQQGCYICKCGFPIYHIPIRISPQSHQSISSLNKRAFKKAIAHRFKDNGGQILIGKICLIFLFVCSSKNKARDLDNMAKLLMDSIKGVVMEDDKEVDHLSLIRLTHEGDEEYVIMRIASSNLNNHDDTVIKEIRHSWAGAEPLILEDFIN